MLSQRLADNFKATESFRKRLHEVIVQEGGFVVKDLAGDDEMSQAFRLRHRIFCEHLRWVPKSDNLMEIDGYDCHAAHIGVFDGENRIVAFSRLIFPGTTFMIEKESSPPHWVLPQNQEAN